jgi:serine/threonine protein kinase
VFNPVLSQPLKPLLPNLPPHDDRIDDPGVKSLLAKDSENAVSFIEQLVRYPPESRAKAPDLLRHHYFSQGCSLVLPPAHMHPDYHGQDLMKGEMLDNLPELISQLLSASDL